jgi:murein DD-endopeptidase MepM/ murein hydrolase activator NlpD
MKFQSEFPKSLVTWPGGGTAENVYHELNEKYLNTLGGAYPVGKNCWHGGIHINESNNPIYPMTNGVLIAYRINDTFLTVPRKKIIDKTEYGKLDDKSLYDERQPQNEIERAMHNNNPTYELNDPDAVEKITNGFILLKQSIVIPKGDKDTAPYAIPYFTLYANLRPYCEIDEFADFFKDFRPVSRETRKRVPFYLAWRFKVTSDSIPQTKYTEKDGIKVFAYSTCSIKTNIFEHDVWECAFDNGTTIAAVSKNDLEITGTHYKTKEDGVRAYSFSMTSPDEKYLVATLKRDKDYYSVERHDFPGRKFTYQGGYVKGYMSPDEIYSRPDWYLHLPWLSAYKGLHTKAEVNDLLQGSGAKYQCTEADESKIILRVTTAIDNGMTPYVFNKFENVNRYKIVRFVDFMKQMVNRNLLQQALDFFDGYIDYSEDAIKPTLTADKRFVKELIINREAVNNRKNGRLKTKSPIFIVVARPDSVVFDPGQYKNQDNQFACYYQSVSGPIRIKPFVDLNSNTYNALEATGRADDIEAYRVTPVNCALREGSFIEIPKNERFANDALGRAEGLIPCRFYPEKDTKVLIKADGLEHKEATGRVREPNGLCTQTAPGLVAYDHFITGNARYLLEPGAEFEVINGHEYLENPAGGNVLRIRYQDRELYVKTVKPENFNRKLALGEKYKANTAVNTKEAVNSKTVLGYANSHRQYKTDFYYDCATFFLTNTFMAETAGREAPVYVIPEHEVLYEESDYGSQEHSFEAGTVINYSEAGEKEGDAILQVSIASVELPRWLRKADLNKATFTKEALTLDEAAKITLFTQNPLEYQFTEKERTGILADTLVLLKEKKVVKTAAMVEYCQHTLGDKLFYLRKLDRDAYKENILDWEKHFIVYDPQSDNLVYNPADKPEKEIEEVIRKEPPPAGREWTAKELVALKRTLFCKHPLEWDKTKYDSALIKNRMCLGDEDRHKILREKVEKMDIWSSIKDNEAIKQPTNNFWFAHPIYFLNHLDKAGLLDQSFNPYFGKGDIVRGDKAVRVVDNPGFAPKYKEQKGNNYEGGIFKKPGTDETFAVPTGIFGQWYADFARYHEGVDFRGEKGAPIYSFIHAKVIECGWTNSSYGQIVLFANAIGKGMYMIAHLDRISDGIEKDVQVSPGDIVGYVGNSGGNFAEHLHVSYYDVQYDQSRERTYYIGKDTNTKLTFTGIIGYNKESEKNPFWHNSGSCASKNATNV